MTLSSGYRPCACRDCFEIAIGEVGALCWECDKAGCEPCAEAECDAPGAYGGDGHGKAS